MCKYYDAGPDNEWINKERISKKVNFGEFINSYQNTINQTLFENEIEKDKRFWSYSKRLITRLNTKKYDLDE